MKKTKYIISILILTLLGIGLYYLLSNSSPDTTKKESGDTEHTTYEAESEGSKFNVPTDVDQSSIKNYELVTENEQFKIRKLDNKYVVTLYPIVNRPDQSSYYNDQLREYKQKALDYLREKGVNTETAEIIYEPDTAKDL